MSAPFVLNPTQLRLPCLTASDSLITMVVGTKGAGAPCACGIGAVRASPGHSTVAAPVYCGRRYEDGWSRPKSCRSGPFRVVGTDGRAGPPPRSWCAQRRWHSRSPTQAAREGIRVSSARSWAHLRSAAQRWSRLPAKSGPLVSREESRFCGLEEYFVPGSWLCGRRPRRRRSDQLPEPWEES
jgi:hypothetical protein